MDEGGEEMAFNQTREVLDHARKFHCRLEQFYISLQHRAPEEQTRELLGQLIEHEQVLNSHLKEYEEEVSGNILDTFFKYMLNGIESHFSQYAIPDRIDTPYVIQTARHFDRYLEHFYKEMAQKTLSEQVREVFLNLKDMEQREQISLSKQELGLL
jgi:rubrerythrin